MRVTRSGGDQAARDRDEENRERQRAQDIDSALSMSRARSNSVQVGNMALPGPHPSFSAASDANPPLLKRNSQSHGIYTTTSMLDESPFPMLEEHEEEDIDVARHMSFGHGAEDEDDLNDYSGHCDEQGGDDEGEENGMGRSAGYSSGDGRIASGDMHMHDRDHHSMSYGSGGRDMQDPNMMMRGGVRISPNIRPAGMMMGGMGPMKNQFDFSYMEEFAEKEREQLGLNRKMSSISAIPISSGSGGSFHTQNKETMEMMRDGVVNEVDLLGELTHKSGEGNLATGSVTSSTGLERTATIDGESTLAASPGNTSMANENEHFIRRRNRKLSASNPIPHARRQAKLALFEGFGGGADAAGPDVSFAADSASTRNGQAERGAITTKASRFPKNLITGSSYTDYPEPASAPLPTSHRERPYRFSFYSNAMPATIHARSLCELPSEDQTFSDLFAGKGGLGGEVDGANPSPRAGAPDSEVGSIGRTASGVSTPINTADAIPPNPKQSLLAKAAASLGGGLPPSGGPGDGDQSPRSPAKAPIQDPEASTWWLDVLSPTDDEMRMFAKVFGIHPLTTEDILLEETREKIELFRNYYLVCFRSFDQDPYSQTYLEPLNMYIIVFREGTLSFHFRGTTHPQNVRRRIKSLKDYISVTSDWISYALIDDITDAFGPLIQGIEYEVDGIDELVLILKEAEQSDMLRRIGTCRKKVMGLLRLMGNKADVVKGLAKRCNENWSVAPRSDIGLYLSDIQDHLITMTQNLNHYEKILSRSHSNYLAQISIEMTDANNQINDVLSKLTALGTVLIPMNLVTGLWGMNVHVPGQDVTEGYVWFGSILGGLALFAVVGAWVTVRIFVRN